MENTGQLNSGIRKHPKERSRYREAPLVHRLPHSQDGDQTAALDLRPAACLASNLVAGLEGSPDEGLLKQRIDHKKKR